MDLHVKADTPDGMLQVVNMEPSDLLAPSRSRKIKGIGDFVAWLKRWGNPATATVYYTQGNAVAVLSEEDTTTEDEQSTVTVAFERPIVARRWLGAIVSRHRHKDFRDFLELRFTEVVDGSALFAKIANLSLAQTFSYDAKLDTDQAYSIAFKSDAGAEVAKLPKSIEVNLPLIEGLDRVWTIKLRLKLTVPTSPNEDPTFQLLWDDQEEVLQEAAQAAALAIGEGLGDGWLVVAGTP